jgi:ribosome-associated toxin RatA of RatAB toxin-antitoxin module
MTVTGRRAIEVYDTLADFPRYPQFCPAVHRVTITGVRDTVSKSEWEVAFRAGVLKWVEEDTFDRAALRIDFHQLEGDIALFEGSWACSDTAEGTSITFTARLDMGIPTLADALEPIAVRTLVDNTTAIVSGLFGGAVRVDEVDSVQAAPAGNPGH